MSLPLAASRGQLREISMLRYDLLLEDEHLVAIVKPSGIAVIPGRDTDVCIIDQLAVSLGVPSSGSADPRLRVVHRLDKETSGVLLFAKDVATQRSLCDQFRRNEVKKEYLALVRGRPAKDAGTIDANLDRHPKSPRHMVAVKHGGKRSVTEWRVEARFREMALIRCFPRTGRTHQIRVHLASIGLPLAIDSLYNKPREGVRGELMLSAIKRGYRPAGDAEKPLMDRLPLHAATLEFTHPISRRRVKLDAPLPKDFRATLMQLRKWSV